MYKYLYFSVLKTEVYAPFMIFLCIYIEKVPQLLKPQFSNHLNETYYT